MNTKRLMILPLYLALLSCKYDALFHIQEAEASTTVMAPATGTANQSDLKILSENILRIIETDLKNTSQGKLLMGATQSFSYPGLSYLLEQNAFCTDVSLSKRSDAVTESFLELNCTKIKGTKEVRSIKTEDTRAFEGSSNLMIYDKEAVYELRERSALKVAADGSFRLEREYADLKKEALSTSEIAGSLNYDILANGLLEFDGTASLYQDGSPSTAFMIQGNNLHYATCGIDQGTIEFTAGKKKLTVKFQACHRYTIEEIN